MLQFATERTVAFYNCDLRVVTCKCIQRKTPEGKVNMLTDFIDGTGIIKGTAGNCVALHLFSRVLNLSI